MLDSDLAKLYQCKNGTKEINKAVKRNIERFPEDFYFQLTKKEYHNLKVKYNNIFYDRYIIIDKSKVYHLGASINHAGSKTFSINILTDKFAITNLLKKMINI